MMYDAFSGQLRQRLHEGRVAGSGCAALLFGLLIANSSHAEFVVDGILTPGYDQGYTEFLLDFNYDGQPTGANDPTYTGRLWLGFGENRDGTGGSDDIFIMLEVPTEIQDLTYGDNASWGWYDTSDPDPDNWTRDSSAQYDKVTGSENWKFCFGQESECKDETNIQIKMKDRKADGLPPGFVIKDDGDGTVLAASTSLDYNLLSSDLSSTKAGSQTMTSFIEDSPFCGDIKGEPHSSDQDCYDALAANYDDYEFAQRYELQIDNSMFALTDISDVADYINNSIFHASRPKFIDENTDFELPCLDPGGSCTPTTPPTGPPPTPGVPLPSSLSLFALAGALMCNRRRRATPPKA